MISRRRPILLLLLLAPVVAGQADDLPRLPEEDGATKTLRQKLEAIHAEAIVGGARLEETATYGSIDGADGAELERIHQILMLITTPESQKIAAIRVLTSFRRTESVYPLMLTMNDPAEDFRVRAEILERIGTFADDRAVIPLSNVLKGKEDRLHPAAARGLSAFGENSRAQRYFERLVLEADPSTRGWAARAVGWSGWRDGAPFLVAAAERERDPKALGRFLQGLADLKAADGVGLAVRALDHEVELTRAMAAEALGAYGAMAREKGLEPLLDRLERADESVGVRGTIATAIPRIAADSDDAARRLAQLMGSPPDEFDMSVKVGLRYMSSRWLVLHLIERMSDPKETERRRHGAWQVLRAITEQPFPAEPGPWREWWSAHGDGFNFPHGGGSN